MAKRPEREHAMQANIKFGSTTVTAEIIYRRSRAGFDVITDVFRDGWRIITNPDMVARAKMWNRRLVAAKKATIDFTGFTAADTAFPAASDRYNRYNYVLRRRGKLEAGPVDFASGTVPAAPVNEPKEAEDLAADEILKAVLPEAPARRVLTRSEKVSLIKKLTDFFSEFKFVPQVRFVNTIAQLPATEIPDYCIGYFSLTNNTYVRDIERKMRSPEFQDLCESIAETAESHVNQRLEIFYGEPGGGKTFTAMASNPGAAVVVCHPGMSPDELFRGFDFERETDADGNVTGSHAIFKECAIRSAMENGEPVILDEINLLSTECLRTLQAICDSKDSVTINNDVVAIRPGFKVVGTMNLVVDEQVFGLPGPLVDRAMKIEHFQMAPEKMAEIAF